MQQGEGNVFTSSEFAKIIGVSVDSLDHMVCSGLLVPSVRKAFGQGSRRLFSTQDVQQGLLIQRLRKAKWKPRQVATALNSLRAVLEDPDMLETPRLIHEGGAFLILCRHKGNELVLLDGGASKQYVMVIALETLEEETRLELARSK